VLVSCLRMSISFLSVISLVVCLAVPWVVVAGTERFTFERSLMGTQFTVVCHAEDADAAARAADAAFGIAEKMNATASDYLADSELSLLSSQSVGTPIRISEMLYDLLEHSRQLAEMTDGAFDPTLGPLTKLWRETRDDGRLPGSDMLESARAATGWRYFTLDPEMRTVTLHRENMAFDLGGVAKGYAADLMLESLADAGISRAMIVAGGDIRLGDPPPGRGGWRVALQTFDPARPDEVVTLANAAVSTSGDLHQWVEVGGIRHSHIVDPATGLGLTRRIAASVIADQAKFSDPIATAACVLGPDASDALRQLPGVREVRIRTLQETASAKRNPNVTNSEPYKEP